MENKKLGIKLFNETWDLIDKTDRTQEEALLMLDKAHASSLFWALSSEYKPVNGARSQWQISHVCALLGLGESSLFHAKNSLEACVKGGFTGNDLAFGYSAVARAYYVLKDMENFAVNRALAVKAADGIETEGDRAYFLSELCTIDGSTDFPKFIHNAD